MPAWGEYPGTGATEEVAGVTAGTAAANKAVVLDGSKGVTTITSATITTVTATDVNTTDADAGASGTAGTVDVFPSTASKGKLILSCVDQDGDTTVTLTPAAMGQASVVSIPDPGASTANVLLTDAANDGVVVSASAAEIDMAADSSANTEAVVTTNAITAAESGKTFFLDHATGFVSTLPAVAAGLHYTFIVKTIPTSGNDTIVTNSSANVIEGAADVDSTLILAANEDSINIVASTALVGDRITVICDGTSWFVDGFSGASGGITFTATG